MAPRSGVALVVLCGALWSGTSAAQLTTPDTIRLVNRVFAPRVPADPRLPSFLAQSTTAARVHLLVQFRRLPGTAAREILEQELHVQLLDPIPERAYVVAAPPDSSIVARLVTDARIGVSWVGTLEAGDRIAPWVLTSEEWALARGTGGERELIVEFFGDTDSTGQRTILESHGIHVLERYDPLDGWLISADSQAVLALSTEDAVKWIDERLGTPTSDNDGIRSATGVNSDAVGTGTPYNLTGSGVSVAMWDGQQASVDHVDFGGRVTVGDAILPSSRTHAHDESALANGVFDPGEGVYLDMNDDGKVSPNDRRVTAPANTSLANGTVVVAGDADVARALIPFVRGDPSTAPPTPGEAFVDRDANFAYSPDEPIYRDVDISGSVSAGDTPLTPGTLGMQGDPLRPFPTAPHAHPTIVAGTIIGDGANSAAKGGAPLQWRGIAPEAQLRTYDLYKDRTSEHNDALAHGAVESVNPWGRTHCHEVPLGTPCYTAFSEQYDAFISGWKSSGAPSGLARPIPVVGSAGNRGRPERHTDEDLDHRYDAGESIVWDLDDGGTYSSEEPVLLGSMPALGTTLVNFALDEMHDEEVNDGSYDSGEAVYADLDGSRTTTPGDTRLVAPPGSGLAVNVPVQSGDADALPARPLRAFRLWGTVRAGNAAKNTLQVGDVSADAMRLDAVSSRGPTSDGRIKPDVVAAGSRSGGDQRIHSTYPGDRYGTTYGTSMATGAVAGAIALVAERYAAVCAASPPPPDVLRALVIHAADDLTAIPNVGVFAGPDFAFGFGRVRIPEAVDLIPRHVRGAVTLATDTVEYTITVGGTRSLRATLVWDDRPHPLLAAASPSTGLLVNDLDLELEAPDGVRYTPWTLNGSDPFAPATRASVLPGQAVPEASRDHRNTVEQVEVENAMPGTWTIRVIGSTLYTVQQPFALVSEMLPPRANPCDPHPAADVWMRDNPTDDGTVPSSGPMYLGPDLWNRLAADGATDHQNPSWGQENYLYAILRNATAVSVGDASIDIWIAPAALGLVWPDNFSYVGRFHVPNLGPLEVRKVGPLAWHPPLPFPSDHFCLYMRVVSPQDPITSPEGAGIGANARWSNNIAYRNMNVVSVWGLTQIAFQVRNVRADSARVEVAIRVPPALLDSADVMIGIPRHLQRRMVEATLVPDDVRLWRDTLEVPREGERPSVLFQLLRTDVTLPGIALAAREASTMTLVLFPRHRFTGPYDVYVTERISGEEIGGIRYSVRGGNPP